ncbi:MAG: hypothetical protein E7378_04800 [Clostridiales bacterium]|nr:hypothetical protein [Clostridiales bacterium]
MKKRVKLFTTIASLCLAVALMAFGVYAATNVHTDIASNIHYTSTGIDGTWAIEVTAVGGTVTNPTSLTNSSIEITAYDTDCVVTYTITFTPVENSTSKYELSISDLSCGTGVTGTAAAAVPQNTAGQAQTIVQTVTYTAEGWSDLSDNNAAVSFTVTATAK